MAKKNPTRQEIALREKQALKDSYIRAFIATGFYQTKAMESCGIKSRATIGNWKKSDPAFAQALIDAREAEGDFLENQLRTLARGIPDVDETGKLVGWKEKPDTTATQTILNAKFRDRGYGMYKFRHEHEHTNKKESRIDLKRLTKEEREQWYALLDKATIQDDDIEEAEIVDP